MFEDVGDALDTASQALAGGPGVPGSSTTAEPVFIRGKELEADERAESGSDAVNLPNTRDSSGVIEFIHFGYVHKAPGNHFGHDELKDAEKFELKETDQRPLAIQFRSALEREAVLLSAFMACTQTILDEREHDKGELGAVMDAVGSLTGLGGGGSGVSTAADVNDHVAKVADAGSELNQQEITYKTIHQAGRDLHQARANYQALLKKIVEEEPQADPMGGIMGQLPGLGSLAPGLADIIALIQGIIFKPMDIKVKFYARLAAQQERQVELACNEMSVAAIRDRLTPLLPVWFPEARPDWEAPENPVERQSGPVGEAVNPVHDGLDDVLGGMEEGGNAVKDFFEHELTDAPGAPFLSLAFETPAPSGKKSEPMPMKVGEHACQAFLETLDLDSLPDFVQGIIKTIVAINQDFLHGALEAVMAHDPSRFIPLADLIKGARQRMLQRLMNLALDNLEFLRVAKEFQLSGPMGYSVTPGDLADKGLSKLDDLVYEKIGFVLGAPIEFAMKDLCRALNQARRQSQDFKCHCMEHYLGRLPWMTATMFYNFFFPFWDLLTDLMLDLMDDSIAGPIRAAKRAAKQAKGVVDSGRDALAKANALQDQFERDQQRLADGVDLVEEGKRAIAGQDPSQGYQDAMDAEAAKIESPPAEDGFFVFPLQNRKEAGKGKPIELEEWEEVQADHQWDDAQNPPPAQEEEAQPAAGVGGGLGPGSQTQ